jgi:hypothetical protein
MGQLPVSATTAGAGIGMAVGSIIPGLGTAVGYGIGAAVGAAIDFFEKAKELKKARKKMEQAFYAALLKRYNAQIFASCLKGMGAAMLYIQSLGLKPGTPAFEAMLKKTLSTGSCIYSPKEASGSCGITLYKTDPVSGKSSNAIATIAPSGKVQAYDQNVDLDLGNKWRTACHEMQLEALRSWAKDLGTYQLFNKELEDAKAEEQRAAVTRLLVNAGILALMFGYILRQKSKIHKYREFKSNKPVSDLN